MSIIRVKHDQNNPCVMVDKEDLLQSIHHSFDIQVAQKYGVEEAILIHHFQYWISYNARLKRNFHEGCYWSYQTVDEIVAHFPYMSKERVVNLIDRLCTGKSRFSKKKGLDFEPVLKKGNFNKSAYDRTVWYAFCVPTKWILCSHKMEIGDTQNGDCGNTTPIPHTKPDPKPILSLEKKGTKKEGAKAPVPPLCEFGSFVKLRKKDYEDLCQKEGKEVIDDIIEDINNYVPNRKQGPYKDYAAVIRDWLKKRKKKHIPSSETSTISQDEKLNRKMLGVIMEHLEKEGGYKPIYIRGNTVVHMLTRDSISINTLPHSTFREIVQKWTTLEVEDED